jgi:PhnB protein
MTIKAATPYLILSGKAPRAIDFYQRALGATTEVVMRFGDMDASCPEAQRNRIMHAALRVGSALLMLSDGGPGDTPPTGGPVNVALDFDAPEETRRCFDALATSGKVVQPIAPAPWGALYGELVDEFGIRWMFNCSDKPA